MVNGIKPTNKSNQACLNFENVTLKEGQSRSQWCGLPNLKKYGIQLQRDKAIPTVPD
ncbi:MAG TPA: hypothetical protein V6D21_08660 [Candidatus Obscuribacterales bacterium]